MSTRERDIDPGEFAAIESLDRIRATYGVPAELGRRIAFNYLERREGMIVGTHAAHLVVQFDGTAGTHVLHPTWKLEYLGNEGADQ